MRLPPQASSPLQPKFQSTHPVRGATHELNDDGIYEPISIHAPREGCDCLFEQHVRLRSQFQSTHPVRGATERAERYVIVIEISIHAPREGCDGGCDIERGLQSGISIHAPREGCDNLGRQGETNIVNISIHAPREGCDQRLLVALHDSIISIHAPREGCDRQTWLQTRLRWNFNPRTP